MAKDKKNNRVMSTEEVDEMIHEIMKSRELVEPSIMNSEEMKIVTDRIRKTHGKIELAVKKEMGFHSFEAIPSTKKPEFRKRVKKKHLEE